LTTPPQIAGVLLACGAGSRFGSHKLLHPLSDGTPMAVAALRNLIRALSRVIVVVRSGDVALRDCLTANGVQVVECGKCQTGMAYSIASGVRTCPDASGWIIALADMPFIDPRTVTAVRSELERGAHICIPVYKQQCGHPVGFARRFFSDLIDLQGDRGARSVIDNHPQEVTEIECTDPGILVDIDTPSDLQTSGA
jgi:molybdenum cofactor cytidylyltransferase